MSQLFKLMPFAKRLSTAIYSTLSPQPPFLRGAFGRSTKRGDSWDEKKFLTFLKVALCSIALATPVSAFSQEVPAEDLVGRLLLLAFPGAETPIERLQEFQPAGFLFYPSNVPSTEVARTITRTLQERADYPLLFGIDQEGGPFTTYRVDKATVFPGNMALAATGKPELATEVAQATGEELAYAGFNMNFAPSVDVNSNPDNPIIGIRSFGADVGTVSTFGQAFLAGLEQAGVASVAKHFPGHGDTGTDSHLALPVVDGDMARLEAVELPPFKAMIDAGVPAVMTAHVVFPALDPGIPATLSKPVLTGLLREQLGFHGLIVTDYMDMKAIVDHYGAGEAAVQSVIAGADLVLVGQDMEVQRQIYQALLAALKSGRLSKARVREAVAHSAAVASRYRPQWDAPLPDYASHQRLANEVAAQGATLLWNDGVLPLEPSATVLVVAPQPDLFGKPPHLGAVLKRHRNEVMSVVVSENPTAAEIDAAVAKAQDAEVLILGSYHWLGAFPEGMKTLEARLAQTGKPLVVVALGNPDDLRFLPVRPDAYLAVYGYREANLEGASVLLTGEGAPQGNLPVPAGEYPLGAGQDEF